MQQWKFLIKKYPPILIMRAKKLGLPHLQIFLVQTQQDVKGDTSRVTEHLKKFMQWKKPPFMRVSTYQK